MRVLAALLCLSGCVGVDDEEYAARLDRDGDGDRAVSFGGGDCNDNDASVHSNAAERCNGADDDCNGVVDDTESAVVWWADEDGDGFGDPDSAVSVCDTAPTGHVQTDGDCDDTDAAVHPDALEDCNGVDDDCDGAVDEVEEQTWYVDADSDGYGDPLTALDSCLPPGDDYVLVGDDCDDSAAAANPGQIEEICNDGLDNNCDGSLGDCRWAADTFLHDAGQAWIGEGDEGAAGTAVAGVGDITGDGVVDVAVGAPGWGRVAGWEGDGGVFLMAGPVTVGDPQSLVDQAQVVLSGSDVSSEGGELDPGAGTSLFGAFDSDGDGHDDLLIGAPGPGGTPGSAFLVRGPISSDANLNSSSVDLLLLGPSLPSSQTADEAGASVAAGDLAGDGSVALVVGAPAHGEAGTPRAGVVYVVAGAGGGTFALEGGVRVRSLAAEARLGRAVALADWDGDGLTDLAIGAPGLQVEEEPDSGAVYVLLGPVDDTMLVADAEARLVSEEAGDAMGTAVATAGDANGDGRADLVVGAPGKAAGTRSGAGVVWLLDGVPAGEVVVGNQALMRWDGEAREDGLGAAVAAAGDVDADGNGDLVLGSPGQTGPGAAWLIHGPVSGGSASVADVAVQFSGAADKARAGAALAGVGDLNGDGLDDIAVGEPGLSPVGGEPAAGAAVLLPGAGF
jgi:hypothetical protein